ncbi:aquaporin [Litorihabitans aurantiacus]|uniref:Aquaporin Z n=1 Tax=Litorihabitans aurantiacus TaxID=1930061 RepID=A0AA37XG32_9MICO|nr:aquaporin [Litorihabitans aurantiacus]GMA32195.1 hypothetical protein GCM10025875_21870 [Litorihabitans aurantiacus]
MSATSSAPAESRDPLDPVDPAGTVGPAGTVDPVEAEIARETDVAPEYGLLARLGAEVFGTFTLVLIGVGLALFAQVNGVAGNGLIVPLGFGIAVLGAASAVGHVSGGHFNPAVSLAGAIAGRISWADLVPYWVAQVLGGTAAAALLFTLVPPDLPQALAPQDPTGAAAEATTTTFFAGTANGFGEFSPLGRLTNGQFEFSLVQALLVEVVATAIFVGVILGVTDKRSRIAYAPAAIGLTLAVLIALAAPITNGSLNPARATAAALFSGGDLIGQLWVFWLAPLLGAAIAGLVYLLVTPAPSAVQEWPETEPAQGEESVTATEATTTTTATAANPRAVEGEESDVDAIDALLARQDRAASEATAGPAADHAAFVPEPRDVDAHEAATPGADTEPGTETDGESGTDANEGRPRA